jgi:hypothetical protein
MTEETTPKQHSSFALAIEPEFDDSNEWTGAVHACIEESIADDLDSDQLTQIRSVCGMLASCLQLLEREEEFRDYVQMYFMENFEEMIDDLLNDAEEREKPSFIRSEDGKVITLNFSTKTYGNA